MTTDEHEIVITQITLEQGRQCLLRLRNNTNHDMQEKGEPIENWENILQGRRVVAMIQYKAVAREEWEKVLGISRRYNKRHDLMNFQLESYWP